MGLNLTQALELWRVSRAAKVAEFIDELSETAIAEAPSIRLKKDFQVAWLDAVRDDTSRAWALAALDQKLPGNDKGWDGLDDELCASMLARLNALTMSDPRASWAVLRWVLERSYKWDVYGDESAPALQVIDEACERILVASGDQRVALALAAYPDHPMLQRALRSIPQGRPLSAAESAAVAGRPALMVKGSREDLAVHADALQTAGDPRGEFIALQLSNANPARAKMLLKRFGRLWAGPIAPAISRAQFERGVLTRVALSDEASAELLAKPDWSTVEELQQGGASARQYERALESPAMTSLRRVEVFSDRLIDALPKRIEFAAFNGTDEQFARLVKLEHLRGIGLPDGLFETFVPPPQLTHLTVMGAIRDWKAALKKLPAQLTLTYRKNAFFDALTARNDAWAGRIEFTERGRGGWRIRVRGRWAIYELLELSLPAVKELTVLGATREQRTRLEKQFSRASLHFEPDPAPEGILVLR